MTRRKKAERPSTESESSANGKSLGRATCSVGAEPSRTRSENAAADAAAAAMHRCPSQTATRVKAPTSAPEGIVLPSRQRGRRDPGEALGAETSNQPAAGRA